MISIIITNNMEFIVKKHYYGPNIYNENKKILDNSKSFPYEIDGLIFTPAKLAVYSFYPNMPVDLKADMTWNNVFKWKPPEQNTIDFLIKYIADVIKDGIECRKFGLYVSDKSILNEYNIKNVLSLRYSFNNIDKDEELE